MTSSLLNHGKGDETAAAVKPPPHVIVVPYSAQGHVNPALQFSKKLVAKGLAVTMVIITSKKLIVDPAAVGPVAVEVIPHDEIPFDQDYPKKIRSLVESEMRKFVIRLHGGIGPGPCCLVYDSMMWWGLHVAKELGMAGAPFFTQTVAINAVKLNLLDGRLVAPPAVDENGLIAVDGLSPTVLLAPDDLYIADPGIPNFSILTGVMARQFSTVREADWVFCNTFYSLEDKLLDWMLNQSIPMKSVGPMIPSAYLSNIESPVDDLRKKGLEYGVSFVSNRNGSQKSIIQWLDSKKPSSVIYASLGSDPAKTSKTRIFELARALQLSSRPFIWVVLESDHDKLPPDFLSAVTCSSSQQLVVGWCNQLEVLAHRSVGCFVTHCGWNSTLEALSIGVPMVALPLWADQPTNAKFVADVWRVGARARAESRGGVVTGEEIRRRIEEVMEGVSREEIRKNSEKWRKLAREAIADGGSSDGNIDEFVASLRGW